MYPPQQILAPAAVNPTMTIASGVVIGTTQTLPSATGVANAYLGIPFAISPPERFAPPKEPEPWPYPLYAQEFSPACLQVFADFNAMPPSDFSSPEESTKEVTGEEDCLYLNIWTPQNASSDLSVMLWIHGGNLAWGFASDPVLNGTSLAIEENIIVVTINYRLSIFGFSNSPEIPLENQNAGFLDQRLALDWVQKNIHNFGGNASKVTVVGQSAGAYSVQQLLASPPNPLPYRAAIIESFARGLPGNGTEAYLKVSHHFNCTNLACLRDLPSEAIRKYAFEAGLNFPPTYDNDTCVQNLTAQVDSGNFARVPFVLGSTRDELSEMVYYLSAEETDPVNVTWERVSDRLVSTGLQHELYASQLYSQLGHEPSTYAEVVRLATDIVFTCPTGAFGNYTADKGFENRRFRWSAPVRGDRIIDYLGALHGSEVPAVFGTYPRDVPSETAALTRYTQKGWSNFVKNLEVGPDFELSKGHDKHAYLNDIGFNGSCGGEQRPVYLVDELCESLLPIADLLGYGW